MRRLPLLLAIVAGVALWAAPSHSQVTSFFKQYTANSLIPGEANDPVDNGYRMCPPHADYCSGVETLYHHIPPLADTTPVYASDVIDIGNCDEGVVKIIERDNDTTTAKIYVQNVLDIDGAGNLCANPAIVDVTAAADFQTYIIADVDGDGVIEDTTCTFDTGGGDDVGDCVPLDGDDGSNSDGDGTARQTMTMYGILSKYIRLCVMRTGGNVADLATDSSYAEVSCR